MQHVITSTYLHNLQWVYHKIDNRGICINRDEMQIAKVYVDEEINRNCAIASAQWGCTVFIGAANAPAIGKDNSVNLNATQGERALLKKLQDIGYEVPKITKRNEEGDYEQKFSTGELSLQKMLVADQFNFRASKGGDPAIRAVLAVRELGKLKSSYFNCRYYTDTKDQTYYLTNYNVAGTLPGRRSSRKHTFGFGNNAQNFPKHGRLAKVFRRCLVARPGNILLFVDLKSADEWSVSALSQNMVALRELETGVDRHTNFASAIFGIPLNAKTKTEWKESIERYLGKKVRHGNNYGMRGPRMSDSLAQEAHSIPPAQCQFLLDRADAIEPMVKQIFHKYVTDTVNRTRLLKTPFKRERQFIGLRPNDANSKIFNEAFAYIPASVTADDNGFALFFMETESILDLADRFLIHECHDSLGFDIPVDYDNIARLCEQLNRAYSILVRFDNGIEFVIPVEFEMGFNFADTKTLRSLDTASIKLLVEELQAEEYKTIEQIVA